MRRKMALLFLSVVLALGLATGSMLAFADTGFYDANGAPLEWEYDANGVSTQTAYKADGSAYGGHGLYNVAGGSYGCQQDGSVLLLLQGRYTVFKPQSVNKEVEISFTMDPNNAWSEQDKKLGRFLFAVYGSMEDAFAGGNNAWQGKNNEKILAWGALDPNNVNVHKISINNVQSKEINYNGNNAVMSIKVGETETAVFFGGEQFTTLNLKRSDFADGKMYISLIAFDQHLEAKIKLTEKDVEEEPVVENKYFNADGTPLTWEYDANGVSKQAAYKADGIQYPMYGMYSPENCYRENADGSVFVLISGKHIVFKPQDVNKEVEISFTMDPSNSWSGQDKDLGRFLFAVYGNMDDAFAGGNSAWQGQNNEKILAWGALDPTKANMHKIAINNVQSKEINYNGNNAVLSIRVGETETEVFFGGEKFTTLNLKRSDFADGKMYISFIAFDKNLEAKIKLTEKEIVDGGDEPVVENKYFNADGTPLTWEYDANGVSKQTAYKADGSKYAMNGMYSPENCYRENADGSVFLLTSGSYTVLKPQDVNKDVVISFTMDPNDSWSGHDKDLGRFLFAVYGNMDDAFAGGNNAWQSANNEKILAWGVLDPTKANMHKITIGNNVSKEVNYNGNNAVLNINVGETNTIVSFGGEQFATLDIKRSDFANGEMYISLIAFDKNLEAKVKVFGCAHTEEVIAGTNATCTATGLTEGKKCSICGTITDAQEEIEKLAHTEEVIAGTNATCTATGLTEGKKCSVCGTVTVEQEEIEKLAHTEEVIAGTNATCTATGLTEGKKCSVCGTVTVEQEEIEKLAHTEEVIAGTNATCTATGLTEGKKCSVCGTVTVEQEVIEQLAHTEEVIAGTNATCSKTGLTEGKKCSVCGTVIVEQEVIEATNQHVGGEATCTSPAICDECGESYGDKIDHEYESGVCKVCGASNSGCMGGIGASSIASLLFVAGIGLVAKKRRK